MITNGKINIFIAGVKTGDTIGVGEPLQYNSKIEIITFNPTNSSVLSNRKSSYHKLQK